MVKTFRGTLGLQGVPAVFGRNLVFLDRFLRHFQKQQVGQFGDVLVVGYAVVAQVVAQVPELLDDVVGTSH